MPKTRAEDRMAILEAEYARRQERLFHLELSQREKPRVITKIRFYSRFIEKELSRELPPAQTKLEKKQLELRNRLLRECRDACESVLTALETEVSPLCVEAGMLLGTLFQQMEAFNDALQSQPDLETLALGVKNKRSLPKATLNRKEQARIRHEIISGEVRACWKGDSTVEGVARHIAKKFMQYTEEGKQQKVRYGFGRDTIENIIRGMKQTGDLPCTESK